MELISIIVPVYMVESYVEECIQSIITQTYSNLQIILVDDGSKDRCPQICDEYAKKDPRIEVVHKENGGLSDARNTGIKRARGEYVFFVDSDDCLESDTIETLYALAKEKAADVVECEINYVFKDHVVRNDTGNILVLDGRVACEKFLDRSLDIKSMVPNKLYRSEIVKKVPFEVGRLHEDMYFTYQALYLCHTYVRIEIGKYNYRQQREGSIMTTPIAPRNIRDQIYGYEKRNAFFSEHNESLLLEKSEASYFRALLHLISRAKLTLKDDEDIYHFLESKIKDNKAKILKNKYMGKAKFAYRLYSIHPVLLFAFYYAKYRDGNYSRK